MSGEERENLGHLLNDILEPRVMTEAEAKFLESLPVAEFPLKRKGPAMNDQAETSDLATLRAENERLNEIIGCYSRDSMRLRARLAAAEALLIETYKQAGNAAPAERRHSLTPGLRDGIRDYIKANCSVAAGWLPAAKGGE